MAVGGEWGDKMELSEQSLTFAVTIAIGALLGILFDFYRVVLGRVRPRAIFTSVSDFIYWIVATIIVFGGLIASNWGELRAYVFIGLFGGAIIYFKLLSRHITAFFIRFITLAIWAFGWTGRTINLVFYRPIAWLLIFLFKPFISVKRKTGAWCKTRFVRPPEDEENMPPKL